MTKQRKNRKPRNHKQQVHLYHYTSENELVDILASGQINPSDSWPLPQCLDAVWASRASDLERSALVSITFGEGLARQARIEVDPGSVPRNYQYFLRTLEDPLVPTGFPTLGDRGRSLGADPDEWHFSQGAVPAASWRGVDVWQDERWMPLGSSQHPWHVALTGLLPQHLTTGQNAEASLQCLIAQSKASRSYEEAYELTQTGRRCHHAAVRYAEQRRYEPAIVMARLGRLPFLPSPGLEIIFSPRAHLHVAQLYMLAGNITQARSEATKAANESTKVLGADHPDTIAARELVAHAQAASDRKRGNKA